MNNLIDLPLLISSIFGYTFCIIYSLIYIFISSFKFSGSIQKNKVLLKLQQYYQRIENSSPLLPFTFYLILIFLFQLLFLIGIYLSVIEILTISEILRGFFNAIVDCKKKFLIIIIIILKK
jgi:hypothetical protein